MHANEGPFQHRAQLFFCSQSAHSTEKLHNFFLYETLYSMKTTTAEKERKITSGRIVNNIFSLLA